MILAKKINHALWTIVYFVPLILYTLVPLRSGTTMPTDFGTISVLNPIFSYLAQQGLVLPDILQQQVTWAILITFAHIVLDVLLCVPNMAINFAHKVGGDIDV